MINKILHGFVRSHARLCERSNEKIQSENDNHSLHIDIRLVLPQVIPGRVVITGVAIGHNVPSIY